MLLASFELLREELCWIGEGFELESVSGRVEEEHRGLFADLAFEADMRFDDERDASGGEALGEGLPSIH